MKIKPTAPGRRVKAPLFTIVSGVVLINPVYAQTPAAGLDEVIVTGMRVSLQKSMEVKRESVGVVDAINAEDIGKFPNTNIAESLQRIPGVAIDRQNGEGAQVTVRGFGPGYNLVTLNGRTVPTAEVNVWGNRDNYAGGQGRSFDFSNIASEGVSSLEVFKTGQAILPSGGIGATINVNTLRPFDSSTNQAVFGAKAIYDTSVEKGDEITPEISGLYNWVNDNRTLGFGVFGAYARRDSSAAIGQTNDWVVRRANDFFADTSIVRAGADPSNFVNAPADGQLFAIPQDSRYDASDLSRERINGQVVVQFRPTDSMTLTADYSYFSNENEEMRYEQTNWFATPFDHLVFDGNESVSQALLMQENNNGTKDMGFEQTNRAQKDELGSFGINFEWQVTDSGKLRLDAHTDNAESAPNNPLGHSATFVTIGTPIIQQHSVNWDDSDGFPQQSYTFNDALRGNGNGVIDVGDLGTQVARSSSQLQEVDLDEFDLRWTSDFEKGGRLDVGANYRTSKVFVYSRTTQQDLGSWGIANPQDVELYAPGVVEAFCLSCRFNDYPVGQADVAFAGDAAQLYSILTPIYEGLGNAVSVNKTQDWVDEDVTSLYGQFQVENEFMGREVRITAGLRYEETKVSSTALQSVPTNILWTADNDFLIQYGNQLQEVKGKGDYSHVLPNLDIRVNITDEFVTRMSYSQTVGRAQYADLFASTQALAPNRPTVLGGQTGGNSRNPALLPLESENFDVSLEWYYGPDSYVSVGFFDKTVQNFVGTGVFTRPLFGLLDPTAGVPGSRSGDALGVIDTLGVDRSEAHLFTLVALIDELGSVAAAQAEFEANLVNGVLPQAYVDAILAAHDVVGDANDPEMQFRVSQPINDQEANIYGWEFAAQHFFGDSGFGLAASYTIVNGDIDADPAQDPDENQFALVGLSDTANFTVMYENYGFMARLAYNWRDDFLNGTNQGGSRSPQFTEAYGQLDLNLSYDFSDRLQVMLEGINLTGEDHREYRRREGMTIWAYELAPRYAVGARYKF